MNVCVARLDEAQVFFGDRSALRCSLAIHAGQHWLVMGPNGSGKSTLLDLLAGRRWPQLGEVTLLEHRLGSVDLRLLRQRIALSGTNAFERLERTMTVRESIAGGFRDVLAPWWLNPGESHRPRVEALLDTFGLRSRATAPLLELSDGERTRVELARSLVRDCSLWLLDEPTRALDLAARELVLDAITETITAERVFATVMVVHQLEDIPRGMTHAVLLRGGAVVASGEIRSVLTSSLLSETFGMDLELSEDENRWTAKIRRNY